MNGNFIRSIECRFSLYIVGGIVYSYFIFFLWFGFHILLFIVPMNTVLNDVSYFDSEKVSGKEIEIVRKRVRLLPYTAWETKYHAFFYVHFLGCNGFQSMFIVFMNACEMK